MEDQNQPEIQLLLNQLNQARELEPNEQSNLYCNLIKTIINTHAKTMIDETILESISYYQNAYLSLQLKRAYQLYKAIQHEEARSVLEKTAHEIESWQDFNYSQQNLVNKINTILIKIKNGSQNAIERGRIPGKNLTITPQVAFDHQVAPIHNAQSRMHIDFLLNPELETDQTLQTHRQPRNLPQINVNNVASTSARSLPTQIQQNPPKMQIAFILNVNRDLNSILDT